MDRILQIDQNYSYKVDKLCVISQKISWGIFRVSTYLILHEKTAAGTGMSNASIVFLRYNAFRLKLSGILGGSWKRL
jgi:hypothetical protein